MFLEYSRISKSILKFTLRDIIAIRLDPPSRRIFVSSQNIQPFRGKLEYIEFRYDAITNVSIFYNAGRKPQLENLNYSSNPHIAVICTVAN